MRMRALPDRLLPWAGVPRLQSPIGAQRRPRSACARSCPMDEKRRERRRHSVKAYLKEPFLKSGEARPLRILAEYLEPKSRFEYHKIDDTIVFMGSARFVSRAEAEAGVSAAERGEGDPERARARLGGGRAPAGGGRRARGPTRTVN